MKKLTNKLKEALSKFDQKKFYQVDEAVKIVKDTSITKFDSSIELSLKLGIDSKQPDQNVRGSFLLPHGSGKSKKVLVICPDDEISKLKDIDIDHIGGKEMVDKIKTKKWFDFDIIVAHPKMMPEIGKIGQILGPKKLMPNPKSGTVTTNLAQTVKEIKAGKIEYRNDKDGNVHVVIGKVSFDDNKIIENFTEFIKLIKTTKSPKIKGTYIKNISLASTMGPGVKVSFGL